MRQSQLYMIDVARNAPQPGQPTTQSIGPANRDYAVWLAFGFRRFGNATASVRPATEEEIKRVDEQIRISA